jgi:septum formation protein
MAATAEPLILASASAARAALLRAAAVDFSVEPAAVDEARLKRDARAAGDSAIGCAAPWPLQRHARFTPASRRIRGRRSILTTERLVRQAR